MGCRVLRDLRLVPLRQLKGTEAAAFSGSSGVGLWGEGTLNKFCGMLVLSEPTSEQSLNVPVPAADALCTVRLSKKGVIPYLIRDLHSSIRSGDTGSGSGMTELLR